MTKLKHMSTVLVAMATKSGKMLVYFNELLLIKLHDPLVTWSCQIK